MNKKIFNGIICLCVECSKKATEGSMKHPYCKQHFKEIWDNDLEKYNKWINSMSHMIFHNKRPIRVTILKMLK